MNPGTTMVLTLVPVMRKPCTTSGLVTRNTTGVSGRHHDALRHEGILLCDDAHDHRSVRLNRRAEVGFHELAGQMKAAGVDRFHVRRRLGGPVQAGEG